MQLASIYSGIVLESFCDFAGRDSPHRDGILRPLESPTFSGQQVLFEPVFLFLVQRQIDELDASL